MAWLERGECGRQGELDDLRYGIQICTSWSPARSGKCRIAVSVPPATAVYPVMAAMLVIGPISPLGRDDIYAAMADVQPAGEYRTRVLHPSNGRPAEPETDTNRTKSDRRCIAEVPPPEDYWIYAPVTAGSVLLRESSFH
ncbi:hypothetical protein AB0H42_19655 [Nocardia sp. NPDC050799]|uniref:hypothetical protein n=1 Tax=Nocardia sp. NPDC050799 TaxID=3154842 RepID=UPI0033DD219A